MQCHNISFCFLGKKIKLSKKEDKGLKHVTTCPNLTFKKKKKNACPENTVLPFRVHKYDSKLRDCLKKKKKNNNKKPC